MSFEKHYDDTDAPKGRWYLCYRVKGDRKTHVVKVSQVEALRNNKRLKK